MGSEPRSGVKRIRRFSNLNTQVHHKHNTEAKNDAPHFLRTDLHHANAVSMQLHSFHLLSAAAA